ncbi:MAG: GNAT family N-acetyltransferase [Terrimonas sp.]|nr:GNAT family N-acetyltransferase [Terrimonas sp.]
MDKNILSVREMQYEDIKLIIDYWMHADENFLHAMGADKHKLPSRDEWQSMLENQLTQSYREKQSYCITWLEDGVPIGHSNVNKIVFGEEAFMHLHIWKKALRQKGAGKALVLMTLPFFFYRLELKTLYCEPYALNPAPNRTLEKTGFVFVRNYTTIPGSINFEQPVNRWQLTRETFLTL